MFDVKDDAKGAYRRVEVLTGPGRRRRWSDEEKARMVAESLAPGAVVCAVARRWQVCPQQLYGWRREAREGSLVPLPRAVAPPMPAFVPIVAEAMSPVPPVDAAPVVPSAPAVEAIEVELAGAVVRVRAGVDATLLAVVLRAVRVSASPA